MSNEIFVDGICEIDDQIIRSYFSKFGCPIKHYESHRHRPTNSCCFALILFESFDTVDQILAQRPHELDEQILFVKRLLPPSICSFIERLLPVSSLFIQNKFNREYDEDKLRTIFNRFGRILRIERDFIHDRVLIEFDDYDSVDQIFLNKNLLPAYLDVHKNILPRAQNAIEYHGRCHRQANVNISNDEKKKKRHRKKRYHSDEQYEDLLQKTIEDLIQCKAQLRNLENDCVILRMENQTIKDENEKLNQLVEVQKKFIHSCQMCEKHQIILNQLEQIVSESNESGKEHEKIMSIPRHQYTFSTRLNPKCSLPLNLQTPVYSDLVAKQYRSSFSSRIAYKYHYVKNDEDEIFVD